MRKRIKKIQKKVTRYINQVNQAIKNDWLWNGRFYFHQIVYDYYDFPDGSGGVFTVTIEARDHKTGKKNIYQEHFIYPIYPNAGDILFRFALYHNMNNFIVDYVKVWSETPDPYDQARLEGRKPDEPRREIFS